MKSDNLKSRIEKLADQLEDLNRDLADARAQNDKRELPEDIRDDVARLNQAAQALQTNTRAPGETAANLNPSNRSKLDRHLNVAERKRKAEAEQDAAARGLPPPNPEQYLDRGRPHAGAPIDQALAARAASTAPATGVTAPAHAPAGVHAAPTSETAQTDTADTASSSEHVSHAPTPPGVTRHNVGPHGTHAKGK